ncbi:MAG: PaaI family thioesterase [Desulfobacterales bacterium]|nr:PaaI family thioesterase [Desulfobacterales bacterium]
MKALNPEHIKSVIKSINKGPFFKHLSMQVTELNIGYSKVTATIREKYMNPFGSVHGGVFSSLIDTAAYWAAYCDLREDQGLVTVDLKIDLLAPVLDKIVIVEGKRIKSGQTLCLTEAQMFNESGKILAHGTSKLMVTQNKQTIHDIVDFVDAEKPPEKFLRGRHVV